MAKKKLVVKKKETAGDSRLPIADDAYRPFEEIKKVVPKNIEKIQVKKKQPEPVIQSQRKEPLIKGYDPNANFGDILKSWETTGEMDGVTARMKSHSKVKVEKSFAEILAEWDGDTVKAQRLRDKAEAIKPSKQYVPKKDFGSLLDEFNGIAPKKDRRTIPSERVSAPPPKDEKMLPSKEMAQALQDKEQEDAKKESNVAWSFADTYKQWNEVTDEKAALANSVKEKREEKPNFRSVSALRAMEPEVTLDLHGMKVVEAEEACATFLKECSSNGLRKISIITGKGLHNDKGFSLLKDAALRAIRLSGVVSEAYTPKAQYGGSGAIWIILKEK
ncbi:MAG: DNA mismatch repair protein MutS [Spirochaetia bacterium]|jgi:DNA-nicking Smr family endonuclease|nr:DNA mismatch repair protein MutS [Spirochaetia bacterium]